MSAANVIHVAVGNLNVDIYAYVDEYPSRGSTVTVNSLHIGPGGAAANYAVAAARLGHKTLLVAHTGRLARDLGILSSLEASGVSTRYVKVHDEYPGIVLVVVDRDERTMVKYRGANRMLDGSELGGLDIAADTLVVHFASVEPDIVQRGVNALKSKGLRPAIISYDPGGSVVKKHTERIAETVKRGMVTALSLNAEEAEWLTRTLGLETIRELLEASPSLERIVARLGARGACLLLRDRILHVAAHQVAKVVDPTGAGDVFNAVFNAYLAEGASYEYALRAASIAAGLKVARRGAQAAPSRSEIEEVMRSGGPRTSYQCPHRL